MAATTVTMPQLGESVVEGTIVKWLAKAGQQVERDQPLVEVATDKANTEIPTPSAGVLVEVIAQEGPVVQVGRPLPQRRPVLEHRPPQRRQRRAAPLRSRRLRGTRRLPRSRGPRSRLHPLRRPLRPRMAPLQQRARSKVSNNSSRMAATAISAP